MKRVIRNFASRAVKDLAALDKHIAKRIITKIRLYSVEADPLAHAKQLTGNFSGLFRYRVGDYRVIFEIDSKGIITILTILTIKHRKDIYRKGL